MTAVLAPTEMAAEAPTASPGTTRLVATALIAGPAALAAVYGLVGPRTATFGRSPFGTLPPGAVRPVQSLLTLAALLLGLGVLTLAVPLRIEPRRHGRAAALGVAAVGGAVVLSGWLNGMPTSLGLLALPVVAVATLAFRPAFADVERVLRWSLRWFVWGSLVAGAVAPAWATGPTSSPIGLGSRLAGVATHPNALGPLAVALVVLEWTRRPRRPLAIAAALAVVVWAQSKTSWAALALIVVLLGAHHLGRLAPSRALLARVVLAGVLLVTAGIAFGLASPERSTAKGQDTTETFTGRTAIWEVTVEVWETHPVFGVGPRLWDDAMDRRFASRVGFAPGHAHSQLIHTLGEAGLVGVAALVVALVALCSLAARGDAASRGATTSLVVLLVVSGFSEPPMRSVPFSTGFFLVVATLLFCLAAADG